MTDSKNLKMDSILESNLLLLHLMKLFFDIESLKLDKQFLCVVFGEYRNYCLLFFDTTLNFLEKNMYANLLTRCDDAYIITPYLFIILTGKMT